MTVEFEEPVELLPAALLVVAPHPDDEILGCGLLMRRVAASGGRIVNVWATDGGASHGELDADRRQALVRQRQGEALAGLRALGVRPDATYFLGYPDGALGASEQRILDVRRRLQEICRDHAIDTVVVTDQADGHADHRAAFLIASGLSAPRIYSYPISARYDGEPYTPPTDAIIIQPENDDRKQAALARHLSQREADGPAYPLSAATIDRFCKEPEVFIPMRASGR